MLLTLEEPTQINKCQLFFLFVYIDAKMSGTSESEIVKAFSHSWSNIVVWSVPRQRELALITKQQLNIIYNVWRNTSVAMCYFEHTQMIH